MKSFKNYITENKFVEHMKQIRTMMNNPNTTKYYDWLIKRAKQVKMTPIANIPELDIKALKRFKPQQKMCYMNASKVVMDFNTPDNKIEYVEGQIFLFDVMPIEHAWNKIGDKYFDITEELVHGGKNLQREYFSIIELDYEHLIKHLMKTKMYGDIVRLEYEKGIKR